MRSSPRRVRGERVKARHLRGGRGARRPGVIDGEQVAPIELPDLRTLFEQGIDPADAPLSKARHDLARCACTHRSFPESSSHSGNFREPRGRVQGRNWSHEIAPWIVFSQNVDAIIGPDEPDHLPGEHLTDELDHELELAVIIGRAGKTLRRRRGRPSYIAGYTVFNDIHARDIRGARCAPGSSLLQGDRYVLPAGPVDRHARRRSATRTT